MRRSDRSRFLAFSAIYLACGGAWAAEPAVEEEAAEEVRPTGKLAAKFVGLCGGLENAERLVAALRGATAATLVSRSDSGLSALSFAVPTPPLSEADAEALLFLAHSQLAVHGIIAPTPMQLRAALVGGRIESQDGPSALQVRLEGVLDLYARGMVWEDIVRTVSARAPKGTYS